MLTVKPHPAVKDIDAITTMLIISIVFLLILLISGAIKTYKLKVENNRISNLHSLDGFEKEKHPDLGSNHMYEKKS
ncbi:hypothetical protein [Mangrovimonas aestuarii]|uniref:hypothetical protein n=1 Tax=Mangrovimonas aestuarii TaxID=3018443 RepID=UPI002378B02A|nr:hypothetical protein [Mangrovimonas aestuarii]